ncbi:MAG: ABC transporter ATP-binding protein [Clostridia bacterium]
MALLEVNDIRVSYGVIKAIKGISLEVNEGEIVALIGSNGAGKTTTMQTITGILKPISGNILFKGKDITKIPAHKIVFMGVSEVPEGRHIFQELSVLDNLRLGSYSAKANLDPQEMIDIVKTKFPKIKNEKLVIKIAKCGDIFRSSRVKNKDVAESLEKVYSRFPVLKERRKQRAGTLSGGEQQMLAMGRALMSKPDILLLDEPSMGLSPLYVQQVFSIIKDINEAGTTVFLVEQNAKQALSIADRGYVLDLGKIVLEGDAKDLLNDPKVRKAYLAE